MFRDVQKLERGVHVPTGIEWRSHKTREMRAAAQEEKLDLLLSRTFSHACGHMLALHVSLYGLRKKRDCL